MNCSLLALVRVIAPEVEAPASGAGTLAGLGGAVGESCISGSVVSGLPWSW